MNQPMKAMKRINDVEINKLWGVNHSHSYTNIFRKIAKAQLESCEKEHKAGVRKLFEEMEENWITFPNELIPPLAWRGFKERWLK